MKVKPLALVAGTVLLVAGCCPHIVGTPAPNFHTLVALSADSMRAYIATLEFDTTRYGAARQYLTYDSAGQRKAGPLAVLAPETGAHGVPKAGLDSGRVMAMLKIRGDTIHMTPKPYPLLRLKAGRYYIWVDRPAGQSPDSLRAVIYDSTGADAGVTFHIKYNAHHGRPLCPLARILSPGSSDDYICFTCNSGWCCSDET